MINYLFAIEFSCVGTPELCMYMYMYVASLRGAPIIDRTNRKSRARARA